MAASHIPEPQGLDLRAARPGDPIRVGHCHQIADHRSEARESQARTARVTITRSASRDAEARRSLSPTSRPTITRRATYCHFSVQM
jgi:hypothetical protein